MGRPGLAEQAAAVNVDETAEPAAGRHEKPGEAGDGDRRGKDEASERAKHRGHLRARWSEAVAPGVRAGRRPD